MTRGMKIGIAAVVLAAAVGGVVVVGQKNKQNKATEVRYEQVGRRDLVAIVTASGKIEPDKKVDVSADVTGRIMRIDVKEGDLVKKGQFLMQIDPVQFQGTVNRNEALLASAQASLLQAQTNRDQAKRSLDRATELRKSAPTLISQEAVEQAQQAFDVATAVYESNRAQVEQARAALKDARDQLARTTLYAPMSGRVTRLAVEEGEVAVPGTFSRETGLLMTIADLSVILAKVQVDETDVIRIHPGDSVGVSIDAFPDTQFIGRVTKIGNSAKRAAQQTAGQNDRAVDFDVEITLDNPPPDIRSDLSCTARIVTATRKGVLSIPIIALTVREHEQVPNEAADKARPASATPAQAPAAAPAADAAAKKKKEKEGVFIVRDNVATFRPVKVGIAGDEYFEVLEGLQEKETIVGGTYQAIRDLKDGAKVKAASDSAAKGAKKA
ncbi:MAG: efflux RND transporter periplasmic adaptor subunit [Gemmatimonadales bacterium]|nr:efflux RND transporter periplasmic adaptor subunit [Gemmatimonadales bacterium]